MLSFDKEAGLMIGEPPVDAEIVRFRVEIELNNEVEVLRYIEVEVQTGVIAEITQSEDVAMIGTDLFSKQVQLVANDFSSTADDLARILNY